MTPEERVEKSFRAAAWPDVIRKELNPSLYEAFLARLRADFISIVRAAVDEDRRGRDIGDENIAVIRREVEENHYVSKSVIRELLAHIDFLTKLIHDLKEESSSYSRGMEDERKRCLEIATKRIRILDDYYDYEEKQELVRLTKSIKDEN